MASSGEHEVARWLPAFVQWIGDALSAILAAVVLAAGGMTVRNARKISEHEARLRAIDRIEAKLDVCASDVNELVGRFKQMDADNSNRRGLP